MVYILKFLFFILDFYVKLFRLMEILENIKKRLLFSSEFFKICITKITSLI